MSGNWSRPFRLSRDFWAGAHRFTKRARRWWQPAADRRPLWRRPGIEILEDRCVPSFIPTLPTAGTQQGAVNGLNAVVYTPEGDPGSGTPPPKKLITIMNNSSQVVYPILYDANGTEDKTFGQVVRVTLTGSGQGYDDRKLPSIMLTPTDGKGSGATAHVLNVTNGVIQAIVLDTPGAGYTPGTQLTVTFDDHGHGGTGASAMAPVSNLQTPGGNPIGGLAGPAALYDQKDPFKQTYRGYIGEWNPNYVDPNNPNGPKGGIIAGLQPGHQVTIQVPLVFWDGGRVYFADNGAPFSSANDPGNPLNKSAPQWHYDPAVATYVVGPDVNNQTPLYGANFSDPATGVGNPNGRVMWYHDGSGAFDFGHDAAAQLTEWTIRDPLQPRWAPDMSTAEVQTLINYDVSYVDNLSLPAAMEITNVPLHPVPAGYPSNGPVLEPDNYAWLGSDLSYTQMQDAIKVFTTPDLSGGTANSNGLGTYFGGLPYDQYYLPPDNPSQNITGVHIQKLPAGYQVLADTPNNDVSSSNDPTRYSLVSGGTRAQVDTMNTGTATQGQNTLTGVSTAVAAQLVPGMLWVPGVPPSLKDVPFPKGTTIASITLGTPGQNDSTIVMSNVATASSLPGEFSWTFAGSQYGTANSSQKGETDGTHSYIDNIDGNVRIYVRPGMLVGGTGIPAGTYVGGGDTNSFTRVNLVDRNNNPVTPPVTTGPYTFTGAPNSYIVQKFIDVWYAWADFYVNTLRATGPDQAPTGQFQGSTINNTGRADPNSLVLNVDPNFDMTQFRVGDIITTTANSAAALTANPTGDPTTYPNPPAGYDPSLNYTISRINKTAHTLELSLPAASLTGVSGTFKYLAPQPVVRSSDAPDAPNATTPNHPYKLTFADAQKTRSSLPRWSMIRCKPSAFSPTRGSCPVGPRCCY